jgi:hypothetical protein
VAASVALAALAFSATAKGQAIPTVLGPYDGSIPFNCELQHVGTGTAFPDPGADPFCVEFDKTNQNITDFGLVEFLLQEPIRVAAAVTKCFYFQRDHWTGSIVQGQQPELWNWDGNYFFDRARGVGGVSAVNLRIGGVPFDATPFVPPDYQPFFSPTGGGGVQVLLETNPDPVCAMRVDTPEEQAQVYGRDGRPPACVEPGGELRGRRVGRVRLGMKRERVLSKLGPPNDFRRRVDRWCLVGKGQLRVAYGKRKRAELIRTSGRGHAARGVARGDRAVRARRRLEIEPLFKLGGARVFESPRGRGRRLLVGIAGHRVRWLAIASTGRVRPVLRRTG